jgi:hypothetical protein
MSKEADTPEVVVRGAMRTIEYAVCANGSSPARDFVENLEPPDQRKLVVLLRRMAEHGNVPNEQQFKHVKGKLFEFKKHQIRVFCFRDGDSWILTNGYKKKEDRLRRAKIRQAERIMAEHLMRGQRGRKGGRK